MLNFEYKGISQGKYVEGEIEALNNAEAAQITGLDLSFNSMGKIGKLEMPKFLLYVMNLNHVNNAFILMGLKEVDGVIGADILTSNKAIIDYTNLTLYMKK